MMTKLKLLVNGRKMLASENNWCRGVACQPVADGWQSDDDDDWQWCALGALAVSLSTRVAASMLKERQLAFIAARDALAAELPTGYVDIAEFNDDARTTHADILALYDRAIAKQRKPTNIAVFEKLLETETTEVTA